MIIFIVNRKVDFVRNCSAGKRQWNKKRNRKLMRKSLFQFFLPQQTQHSRVKGGRGKEEEEVELRKERGIVGDF
jgi:hypothetical protein